MKGNGLCLFLLLFAAISCGKLESTSGRQVIDESFESVIVCRPAIGAGTKAAHLTDVPATFHMWGYITGGSLTGNTPNYMVAEAFTKADGEDSWTSGHAFGMVPSTYKVQFWALAPSEATGISGLPAEGTSGSPSFSYTLPTAGAGQTDIIAALSSKYNGYSPGTSAAVSLEFKHLLSSFSFTTGSSMIPACTINSISITGVPTSATYTEGSGWSGLSGSDRISVSPAKELAKDEFGASITGTEGYLMAIPGTTIGSSNSLIINMTVGGTTGDLTVAFPGSGFTLEMGRNYNVALSFPTVSTVSITVTIDDWNEQDPQQLDLK